MVEVHEVLTVTGADDPLAPALPGTYRNLACAGFSPPPHSPAAYLPSLLPCPCLLRTALPG